MRINFVSRPGGKHVTLAAIATLAFSALGGVAASSADATAVPTYTCDIVTAVSLSPAGYIVVSGANNCVASNGAPAKGVISGAYDIVQRSDGTTYGNCLGLNGIEGAADTPIGVTGFNCQLISP